MTEPNRRFWVLLLWVLALPAGALFGQSRDEAAVRLNGVPLFEVSAAGGESASARALRIERRLERIADRPESAGRPILVTPDTDDSRVIRLDDAAIVTVTRADADDHLMPVDALAAEWAGIIADALDRARAGRRSPWRGLGVEIKGAIATAVSRVGASAGRVLPRVVAALVVLALFWAIAASIRRLLRALFRRVVSDLTVENLLKQAAYYAVWVVGILVAADALGFEPGTVVAGLGLTSLALGFALKDILSNFVSGMLILGLRPFEIGDEIVVGATEGMVQQIELRATEIKTYDGRLVLVPNAELLTSRVTNNTASPVRRAAVDLPVGYDTDLDLAGRALLEAAADTAEVLKEPAPSVRIRELGPADIRMELRFWTDSRRADQLATMSAVRARLVQAFRDAGLALPDPDVRRLRIERASEEDPGWNS
jgi:small-conductance mechanosensitive channel